VRIIEVVPLSVDLLDLIYIGYMILCECCVMSSTKSSKVVADSIEIIDRGLFYYDVIVCNILYVSPLILVSSLV
jgi:hypothetical protein